MRVGVCEGVLAKKNYKSEEVPVYSQDESFGEVLISTTGKLCTVDEVIWEILEGGEQKAITKDTIFCVILDMCRYNNSNGYDRINVMFKGHCA